MFLKSARSATLALGFSVGAVLSSGILMAKDHSHPTENRSHPFAPVEFGLGLLGIAGITGRTGLRVNRLFNKQREFSDMVQDHNLSVRHQQEDVDPQFLDTIYTRLQDLGTILNATRFPLLGHFPVSTLSAARLAWTKDDWDESWLDDQLIQRWKNQIHELELLCDYALKSKIAKEKIKSNIHYIDHDTNIDWDNFVENHLIPLIVKGGLKIDDVKNFRLRYLSDSEKAFHGFSQHPAFRTESFALTMYTDSGERTIVFGKENTDSKVANSMVIEFTERGDKHAMEILGVFPWEYTYEEVSAYLDKTTPHQRWVN